MADFETTTDADDCRVWAWGMCDVFEAETPWDVEMGNDLERFIQRVSDETCTCYFHNLRFDGNFLIYWLLTHGYTHSQADRPRTGEFSTLISKDGVFYTITVAWMRGTTTEFRDSLKKLPMSVANVASSFKLDMQKGDIDYDAPRPVGHVLTMEERSYLARDVLIVAKALRLEFEAGMRKLTVGADSLAEYKALVGKKWFQRMYPVLPEVIDADIRLAYRGGFTYADTRFKARRVGAGRTYDVNSLYPSVMYDRLLPYGMPKRVAHGLPSPTEEWPLYIVSVTFSAKLKPGHIPCIQIKGSMRFNQAEYVEDTGEEPVTLSCTSVDLELWQDHYDMDIISYNGGWLFHGAKRMFCDYIDKWMKVKAEASGGMRAIAKLHLNSLYGKFATNPDVTPKVPILDPEDGVVKYVMGIQDTREPVYTAMGAFITAYARDVTIRAAQDHYDVFAYADTDSLHLLTDHDPETLRIHKSDLGAWKHEYNFDAAIFVRAKCYIEHLEPEYQETLEDGSVKEYETHVAGLPDRVAAAMTFSDIENGRVFRGKLVPRNVPGGVVLREVEFTLNM